MIGRALARLRGKRYGDYMWTASGGKFWPLDPRPEDVLIEDIARGLAHSCRYAGQCKRYYSVAEHSVLVSIAVERRALNDYPDDPERAREWALAGLLHDASEAYISDVIRPLKYQCELRGYRAAERRIERAIAARFTLDTSRMCTITIREMDDRILYDEIPEVITLPPSDARRLGPDDARGLSLPIIGFGPVDAERLFLDRLNDIESS